MATRAIHTVFTVGGENEYRTAVRQINAAIKELNSEMDLSKEKFAGQEDTYAALTEKQEQLQRMYSLNADLLQTYMNRMKQVEDSTEDLTEKNKKLRETLDEMHKSLEGMDAGGEEYKKLTEQIQKLEKELKSNENQIQKNVTRHLELETSVNKTHLEMDRLADQLQETLPWLEDMADSAGETAESMDDMAGAMEDAGTRGSKALEALASAEIMDRAKDGFREVVGAVQECIDKYTEFESAIAGVEKTVDATSEQMAEIAQGIRDMAKEIPATTTEIAAVAEAAGQLGIATEDILDFTEVMVKMGTSTNMASEEAADNLARFANITKMDPSNFERLGSSIVALGNSSAATETEIVEMGTRLAATGELVGLTEPEILGMAAALSSLGIEAEAGGTAAAKLFKKLETAVSAYRPALSAIQSTGKSLRELELLEANQSKAFKETADAVGLTSTELSRYMDNVKMLDQISTISGETAEGFVEAWGTNAVGALDLFVTGLGEMDEAGGNAVQSLNEIAGFTEVRLSNAILALASSGGLLTETMQTAVDAWNDNSALAEEAAKRYETTESKVRLLENAFDDLKIALGEDFMRAAEPVVEKMTDLANRLTDAAEASPALSSALAGLGGALGGLAGLATVAGGLKLLGSAMGIFGSMAGPVGIGVAALGGLAAAATVYQANAMAISEDAQELIDTNDALLAAVEKTEAEFEASGIASDRKMEAVRSLTERIEELSEKVNKTDADKMILRNYVDELNDLLPGLGASFDSVTGSVDMSTESIMEFAEQMQNLAKLEAHQQYIKDLTTQQVELEVQMRHSTEAVEENAEKQEKIVERFREVNIAFEEGSIGYFEWLRLQEELKREQAELLKTEEGLLETHEEIAAGLDEVNGNLETAVEEYNALSGAMATAAEEAANMAESQAAAGEAIDAILTKQYQSMLDAAQRAYEEKVAAAEKAAADELEVFKKGLDAQEDALERSQRNTERAYERQQRDELKAFQAAQDERMKILETQLDAEMKALDERYAHEKKLINETYNEQLKLLDREKYDKIKNIDDQIASIEALTEAEEKALEEQKDAERIARAEKAVEEANGREEKAAAEAELAEVLAEITRKRLLEEREAEIAALEETKARLEEEYEAKADAIEEEKQLKLDGLEELYQAEKEKTEQLHSEMKEELRARMEEELTIFKDGQQDKMTALRDFHKQQMDDLQQQNDNLIREEEARLADVLAKEKENAQLRLEEAKKSAENMLGVWKSYREQMLQALDVDEAALKAGQSIAENFLNGLTQGLEDGSIAVQDAADKVALEDLADRVKDDLKIASPSRVAIEIGQWFDRGLALGLEEKAAEVQAASDKLAGTLDISGELEKQINSAKVVMTRMIRTDETDSTSNMTDGTAEGGGTSAGGEGSGEGVVYNIENFNVNVSADEIEDISDLIELVEDAQRASRAETGKSEAPVSQIRWNGGIMR